jgi:hypothetical protein
MASSTIKYFGYGANRSIMMMEAITGKTDLYGQPGKLNGYMLCVQRFDQVPKTVSPNAPVPVSPREILSRSWSKSFRTYTIIPSDKAEVQGMVWTLTPEDRALVREWELVDFGWYKEIEADAVLIGGPTVHIVTEGLGDGQEYGREVNGRDYETWLNDPKEMLTIARNARKEFLERQKTPS